MIGDKPMDSIHGQTGVNGPVVDRGSPGKRMCGSLIDPFLGPLMTKSAS
jgi:hypothetical protein